MLSTRLASRGICRGAGSIVAVRSLAASGALGTSAIATRRCFSANSPRTRAELHRSQAAKLHPRINKHEKGDPPRDKVTQTPLIDREAEFRSAPPVGSSPTGVPQQASADLDDDTEARAAKERTIDLVGEVVSRDSSQAGSVHGPTRRDSQGRHEIRTKLHPEGAIVGRGRVVANFGTRMLVQEVPWEDEADTHTAARPNDPHAPTPEHPTDAEGTRFIATPRGKLGKIVCGDVVLWEWSSNHADSAAFVVQVLPRQTSFQRVDKNSRDGRDEVLLASNFHHICIVCAPQPATNGMLLDRYLAAARLMGVTASIIFNKIDLPEAGHFRTDMDDFRRIGVPVFETSTTPGAERGIEDLRKHLAQTGPNGTPGITIFVGQSGSGKSSLLNALSPSLQLAVNDLSKNHQGRHTTTQTILHQLESGGEIIDSPGFQNYMPSPIPLREVATGFQEFVQPAQLCHYGSRCLHITEPLCGVRLAVRGSETDRAIADEKVHEPKIALDLTAPIDPRAVMARAYQNALLEGDNTLVPDDPESTIADSPNKNSASERHRKREWETGTRRQRQAAIDELAVENEQLKIQAAEGVSPRQLAQEANPHIELVDRRDGHAIHTSRRALELARTMEERGFVNTISKRRYDSYRVLIEQQQELEKKRFGSKNQK